MTSPSFKAASPVAVLAAVASVLAPGAPPASATGTRPVPADVARMLTCSGKTTVKPSSFIISCADANSELTHTRWSKWTTASAVGTTDFGLNLCVPYCAASKISFFPGSKVVLAEPVVTKRYGPLFSKLVVSYHLKGKLKHFSLSWAGAPAFSTK